MFTIRKSITKNTLTTHPPRPPNLPNLVWWARNIHLLNNLPHPTILSLTRTTLVSSDVSLLVPLDNTSLSCPLLSNTRVAPSPPLALTIPLHNTSVLPSINRPPQQHITLLEIINLTLPSFRPLPLIVFLLLPLLLLVQEVLEQIPNRVVRWRQLGPLQLLVPNKW